MKRRGYSAGVSSGLVLFGSGCIGRLETPTAPGRGEEADNQCSGERVCTEVSITPEQPIVGEQVVFDASESLHPDGTNLRYFWTDPEYDDFYNEGPSYQRRFESAGKHVVEVWMGTRVYESEELSTGYGLDGTASDTTRKTVVVEVEELAETGIDVSSTDVNIHLSGDKQSVAVGDNALLSFSATNIVGNEQLTIQLVMQIPAGLVVGGTSFQEGGGQYTSTYVVDGGETVSETVQVQGREAGRYTISGDAVYYFNESDKRSAESSAVELRFFE